MLNRAAWPPADRPQAHDRAGGNGSPNESTRGLTSGRDCASAVDAMTRKSTAPHRDVRFMIRSVLRESGNQHPTSPYKLTIHPFSGRRKPPHKKKRWATDENPQATSRMAYDLAARSLTVIDARIADVRARPEQPTPRRLESAKAIPPVACTVAERNIESVPAHFAVATGATIANRIGQRGPRFDDAGQVRVSF